MRMHSAIFAFCTATPFVMLAYHEKCHELADVIGLPAELRHDSWNLQVESLSRSIELILNDEAPMPSLPVEKAVDMALRNWTWHTLVAEKFAFSERKRLAQDSGPSETAS